MKMNENSKTIISVALVVVVAAVAILATVLVFPHVATGGNVTENSSSLTDKTQSVDAVESEDTADNTSSEATAASSSENPTDNKTVDLVIFMGQSNMAGYGGSASRAPVVPEGHGYWFKSISDPTKLYRLTEPFGAGETNMDSGLGNCQRNGSMVSAFANAYYKDTGVPIVAVFAAQGNTAIDWWWPGKAPLNDAINRYKTAKEWLENNGYTVRNDFMVWCQGESDGWNGSAKRMYKTLFIKMFDAMKAEGIDACFMVRIGEQQSSSTQFDQIIEAQNELCKEVDNVVMVCTATAGFVKAGLMSDNVHYSQEGYNKAGTMAGENAAYYVNTGKKPTMEDPKYGNIYDPYN